MFRLLRVNFDCPGDGTSSFDIDGDLKLPKGLHPIRIAGSFGLCPLNKGHIFRSHRRRFRRAGSWDCTPALR